MSHRVRLWSCCENGHYNMNLKEIERNPVSVMNPNIDSMEEDILYHFSLGTKTHDLHAMFCDVKFVIMGGSASRIKNFAFYMLDQLELKLPTGQTLVNLIEGTDRYVMYKTGPVLCVNHGMGEPSISIMLHELIKLLYHAHAEDVTLIRMGTCGGLGLDPGSVVISDKVVDPFNQPVCEMAILGKRVCRAADLDQELIEEIFSLTDSKLDGFKTVKGTTMQTLDFYEGQGRLDGAFCDYTLEEKMAYMRECHEKGIVNFEMESLMFAAMCHHAKIKGAVICVTILDRLKGDQINASGETMKEWSNRPAKIIAKFIRQRLGIDN